ncbi:MAG TPA: aldehyde dehydrogenase family protein [Nitrososphaerales archaeon]|nr:aldehyde dehydrogenase family protein [Nitrososphaerales archaeon]
MTVDLVINGKKVEKAETVPLVSPGSGKVIDRVSKGTKDDVKEAVEAAISAFERWSEAPLNKRNAILLKAAAQLKERGEEFALTLASEAGKPIRDSRVEVIRAAGVFTSAAQEATRVLEGRVHRVDAYEYPAGNEDRMVFTTREPVGVVAAILPFNFPVNSFAHKVAPALAVGNTLVVKPSIQTPLSAAKMTAMLTDAGLPPGCVNLVTGRSSDIGDSLVEHPGVDLVTFTGSTEVGLHVASKASMQAKRSIMELGGSDPVIVFDDADLEKATKIAVKGRFDYAGQNCNSSKRFFVQSRVADKFIRGFVDLTAKLRVDDPLLEATDVGPVISQSAVEDMTKLVDDAVASGGKILIGGKRIDRPGSYFEPTVVSGVSTEVAVMKQEVFGPIAPISTFETPEEALLMANASEYGLQAAIHTKDYRMALRLARGIRAGSVIVNDSTRLRWDALPFGGRRKTGFGREGVRDTMLEMTEQKLVSLNLGS